MLAIKGKWKLILKPELKVSLHGGTVEQVTHKIQDKSEIKLFNVSLCMVDSFCSCGKTISELFLEDNGRNRNRICTFWGKSSAYDNNKNWVAHINVLYKEAKWNKSLDW